MGCTPPYFGVTRRHFAATTATKKGGIHPTCTPYIPPIYPVLPPLGSLPADLPHCLRRRCGSVWGRSTRSRLPLGVWSGPRRGPDFGPYGPRFWALRARNTPASGGCGYEKGRPSLGGFFHWGGDITQRSRNLSPEPSTMPSEYVPRLALLVAVGRDKHLSIGAAQLLYRRHVLHHCTPAKRNSP